MTRPMIVTILDSWIMLPQDKARLDAFVAGACAGLEAAMTEARGAVQAVGFAARDGNLLVSARLHFPGWEPRDWDATISLQILDAPPDEIRAAAQETLAAALAGAWADEAEAN